MGVFKLLTAEQFKAVLASPHLNTRYEEQVFAYAFAFAFEFAFDRLSSPKHKLRGAGFFYRNLKGFGPCLQCCGSGL